MLNIGVCEVMHSRSYQSKGFTHCITQFTQQLTVFEFHFSSGARLWQSCLAHLHILRFQPFIVELAQSLVKLCRMLVHYMCSQLMTR